MLNINYQKDANKIIHLILDRPDSSVNLMDSGFCADLNHAVTSLQTETDYIGVIVRSNKSTFFAGGDIDMLFSVTESEADKAFDLTMQLKSAFRKLETLGKPVVACIGGSALGGGFETALACTARVAVNNSHIKLGFPEVNLGLLPGAGGVTRMVRHLGIETALPILVEGRLLHPQKALKLGLLDQLVADETQLIDTAISLIHSTQEAIQPWDKKDYKLPGGTPSDPAIAQKLIVAPAMLRQKTRGNLPAPEAILSTMVEGAGVDFDNACKIESRYFAQLATGQVAKNLMNTFWYQQNEINAGKNRPAQEQTRFQRVAVLGAGMMGAGIAYSAAIRGIEVVLKDISLEHAESGKDYSRQLLEKRLKRGSIDEQAMADTLALIHPGDNIADLKECELVIEAVFEDPRLKAEVIAQAEQALPVSAVFGSNTSTLPISGLARHSKKPEQFIGIHFFSPVDKMPLIELICGKQTDDDTLAKAYDFCQQLGKTPIVVNDSRGFFTSRVFSSYVKEGVMMLTETSAAEIENAAWADGFPVGPLAVNDEVTLTLFDRINQQTQKELTAEGRPFSPHPADAIVTTMLAMGRTGKSTGAGFYQYPPEGRKYLWQGLKQQFNPQGKSLPCQDVKDRLLYIMSLETVKCLDEGVLRSVGDGNIGSVLGIGFPVWTGGTLQFINSVGIRRFVERANTLAEQYGERFTPPESLLQMAKTEKTF